jgi:transposase InsO family protein
LLNPKAAERLTDAGVDREVRGLEGASDHAPAWIVLADAPAARRKPARAEKRARPKSRKSAHRAEPFVRKPLLVIDGDSFAHCSYHALPKTILRRGRKPAGAILGFANLLLRLYREEQPRAVLVAWDTLEVPTYRHEEFAEWIARQITEAFPWEDAPQYLIRDRDRIYGNGFMRRLQAMGIRDKPIATASPWQNGFAERLIGSIRRECADHLIVLSEAHLRRILRAYSSYHNNVRTHRSLAKDAPVSRPIQRTGTLWSHPILCGLHHHYVRV